MEVVVSAADLLWCAGCACPLRQVRVLGQPPAYGCPSGCRRYHVDAAAVDQRIDSAAEEMAPALLTNVPVERRPDIYRQLISRVVVGATADDLVIAWRI
jgi:hypothetical protein